MILIRQMQTSDVAQVSEMEKSYFSVPWTTQALEEITDNQSAFYMVAMDDRSCEVVGYCGMYCILGEGDINQVAVKEACRGKGIGRKLLQDFMQEGIKRGIQTFTLEVRASNAAAIRLYESCGFQIEGTRKNFYDKPREDAYIMWKRKM